MSARDFPFSTPWRRQPQQQVPAARDKWPSLVSFWQFNDGTPVARDSAGDNHASSCSSGLTMKADSVMGRVPVFTGNDNIRINSAKGIATGNSPLTMAIWFNPSQTIISPRQLIVINNSSGGGSTAAVQLLVKNNNQVAFYKESGQQLVDSGIQPTIGKWMHVAATWDGTTNRIYINGIEAANSTSAHSGGAVDHIYIGDYQAGGNESWRGMLAMPVVFDSPLSAVEVYDLYSNRFALFGRRSLGIRPVVSGGTSTITGAGAIASLEAFGSATVVPGAVSVTPTGIASAEAFGTAQINQTISGAGNIASAEAFGSGAVVPGVVTITGAGAIASSEAFGSATVSAGGSFITDAGAIASAEAFGSAVVLPGTVSIVGAGGIVSAEAFGSAALSLYLLGAGGIVSAEAFGTAALQHGTLTVSGAGGIVSAEAFGDALLPGGAAYILGAGGIASGEAFGPVPLIPQNYTPSDRILEVEGGGRLLDVPGGDRVLIVPDGNRVLEVEP